MHLAHLVEARLQQSQRIDPRQILASEILTWTAPELEAAVEREIAENPALELRDAVSGGDGFAAEVTGNGGAGPALGPGGGGQTAQHAAELDRFLLNDRRRDEVGVGATAASSSSTSFLNALASSASGEWDDDPLDRVAFTLSLRDHLREQVGQVARNGVRADVVRYLIECVDDRGYLLAEADEVAERFRAACSTVEAALRALQTMDPPGVGARDLRECLLLQAEYLEQAGEGHPLARRILTHCWEELAARREERIASRLRAPLPETRAALQFIREGLTPYPGSAFRPQSLARGAVSGAPAVRPDIVFHRTEAGFVVELTRDFESALTVAPLWQRLSDRTDAAQSDEAMRRYIRDYVERAHAFLNGVSRRGRTLRAIALALVECQQGFIETGNRAFLRPLTRQSLAEQLELDESVISRAVTEKWAQLPSGEVVPLDAFFGNAHAVREALVNLIAGEDPANPYSDDEIADALTAQGFPLARRTVAKYRGLEKILPARLRKRAPSLSVASASDLARRRPQQVQPLTQQQQWSEKAAVKSPLAV
ncbi:MAG TPA: hypothetical protein VM490_08680 [Armatimonadaceae bacterium]|nr:hypothetical protein [Armatimonadaceae bacterium]